MAQYITTLRTPTPAVRGAFLLDRRFPEWCRYIKLSGLTVSSGRMCILGQIFGSVENGSHALGFDVSRDALYDHGFAVSTIGGYEKNLAILDAAWLTEIEKRVPTLLHKEPAHYC